MEIAKFKDGRPITYEESTATFAVGGAPVSIEWLTGWDQAGQVSWSSGDMKAWAQRCYSSAVGSQQTTQPSPTPAPSREPRGWPFYLMALLFWGIVAVAQLPSAIETQRTTGVDTTGVVLTVTFVIALPVYLLLGFTSAWVQRDAWRRGMNTGWAVGVFLLWIVFFPVYLFARAGKQVTRGTKVCPHCAERIQEAASVCRFCGRDLPSPAAE